VNCAENCLKIDLFTNNSAFISFSLVTNKHHYCCRAWTGGDATGLLMHDVAFLPMLLSQSSDEQLQRWFPLVESHRMIGSYAQTELGHGR
jgi:alkylation response protein AidB-like acyl-CoA dehydrogenase